MVWEHSVSNYELFSDAIASLTPSFVIPLDIPTLFRLITEEAARDAVANKNTIYHRHLERRPEWIIIYYFYLLICHYLSQFY